MEKGIHLIRLGRSNEIVRAGQDVGFSSVGLNAHEISVLVQFHS